jgi:superfamily II DNA or RNA helicase
VRVLLRVTISSVITFKYEELENMDIRILEHLKEMFSYENPKYIENERYGYSNHNVDEYINTYFIKGDYIHFSRGSLNKILNVLYSSGIKVNLVDKRLVLPEVDYPWSKIILRPEDQVPFVEDLYKGEQGLGRGYTSFGKTVSGLELIRKTKQPALIIVHTQELQKQWYNEAINPKTFNMPKHLIGGCGGMFQSKPSVGQLNICLYHSLSNPIHMKNYVSHIGTLLTDEVQRGAIDDVRKCIKYFPAKWRIGVSANERRKDGKEFIIYDMFGEVLHTAVEKDSASKIKAMINCVETDYEDEDYKWDRNHSQLLTRMALDQGRNTFILRRVITRVNAGLQCLIFVERKLQAFILAAALMKKGIRVAMLLGKMEEDQIDCLSGLSRQMALDYEDKKAFEYLVKFGNDKEQVQVIIGTQKIEVGVSIRTLNYAIATTPVAGSPEAVADRFNQMVGRIERTHSDELVEKYGVKPVPVFEALVDTNVSGMQKHITNIKRHYGKRVTIIRRK